MQNTDYCLEVFRGDSLPFRDFAQRYVSLVVVLSQINHYSKGITAFGRDNHHETLRKKCTSGEFNNSIVRAFRQM